MSASALTIAPGFARIFGRSDRQPSGPVVDLNVLLDRIGKLFYPENVPVLASWWLKTIYTAGHNRVWWGELEAAMKKTLRHQSLDDTAAEAIRDIQKWVRQAILSRHKAPEAHPILTPPFRPDLTPDEAATYLSRVLNEWLPREVARILTTEADPDGSEADGMPPLTVARALERLMRRERFSPASVELLAEAAWLSPTYAYPAHLEIFRAVALALVGRTAVPPAPVLPAAVVTGGFSDAVERASLVSTENGDELHIPLDEAQAQEVLQHEPVRIESMVVTMDGRWWQSALLQKGPGTVIVYRPRGRLRIDFSCDHARMLVPWPDAAAPGAGAVHLPGRVALFGREWRGRTWEWSAGRTCLHLEFAGPLALPETLDAEHPRPRRLRPASIEMAWSEVEHALAAGVSDSIDQLHREDLIPLAHALERLMARLLRPWPPSREDIQRSVQSVRYLHGSVAAGYGPIPWRVLPDAARTALLKRRDAPLADLLTETFDGVPPAARTLPPRAA